MKNDRGDVNHELRTFDDTYWRERNDAAWEDKSIQRHLPQLNAEIAALKARPGVGDLHNEAVARHRAKRDDLLRQPAYQTMREQLRSASKLPPQEEALLDELGLVV